ncbi:hypothetical protein [Bacillus sp. EB01]|uniref:hypothetical protein n=1 Tax=Bacillus sp. EB01 TaxID=1347086 RepID=UPI0005C47E37|nr:hypothetical protein [Bacillus sp. EB01]
MGTVLPTLDKLKKKLKDDILDTNQASKLLGITNQGLRERVRRGYYKDAVLINHVDFQLESKYKYFFIKSRLVDKELPTPEEYEELNGVTLISFKEACKILYITPNTMRTYISKGMVKSLYVTNEVDIRNTRDSYKYLFLKDKVDEISPYKNTDQLPSVEELEQRLGSRLIMKFDAVARNSRMKEFDETLEEFKGIFVKYGVDFFDHSGRYKKQKPTYLFIEDKVYDPSLPSVDEIKSKHPDLIHYHEALPFFNCKPFTLNEILKRGYYSDLYLKAGRDFRPSRRVKYLFNKDKIQGGIDIREHFTGLEGLSKLLAVNIVLLKRYSVKGFLEPARVNGTLYEIQWVKDNFYKIAKENKRALTKNRQNFSPLDFLKEVGATHLLKLMEEAVTAFLKGGRIGNTKRKKRVKQEETRERIMRKLGICMYKIICGRSGIDKFWEMNTIGKYRPLNEEELEKFDPSLFEVTDFNPEDIDYIAAGYEESTYFELITHYFKPFIDYVLASKKQELRKFKKKFLTEKENIAENRQEYERLSDLLDLWEEDILDAFDKTPQFKPVPKNERIDVHLTREQLLLASKRITEHPSFQFPIKRKAIFLMGGLIGIRNDELCHLKISDFALNEDGYLQRFELNPDKVYTTSNGITGPSVPTNNENGYGLVYIRKEISKGEYGASPMWGTYIPPGLVTTLDSYFKILNKKHPNTKGEGYLFRSRDFLPDEKYSSSNIGAWIREYRDELFNFLPENERKSFRYYDLRHTVAEILVHNTHLSDKELEKRLKRVAELHIRHDMNNLSMKKPLVEKTYAKDANAVHYFKIMDEALNFPFNLKPLEKAAPLKSFYDWEINKGYRKPQIVDRDTDQNTKEETQSKMELLSHEETTTLAQLNKDKEEKEQYLADISKGYKRAFKKKYNLEEKDWLYELPRVKKEIEALDQQIKDIKNAATATAS